MKDNIFVMDKMRTADQVFVDIDNKLSVSDKYKWIAIDFMQCVAGEKYLSDYEKISNLDRRLFEINKKHHIPVFRLTQAPKERIQSNQVLGMGDEKGSGEISHLSRYALSINPAGFDREGERVARKINIYKTSFRAKCELHAFFDGPSGRLENVMPAE